MTTSTLSTYYPKKRFCSTSAHCKFRPRAQILLIRRKSWTGFWNDLGILPKRAEDDKLMKFQRATEFTRVPPDDYAYKYIGSPSIVYFHYIVSFKPKYTARWQLCARGIRSFKGKPRNCTRFRQGIERGYRSENGLSACPCVRMGQGGSTHT
jgi:hypothetical protein